MPLLTLPGHPIQPILNTPSGFGLTAFPAHTSGFFFYLRIGSVVSQCVGSFLESINQASVVDFEAQFPTFFRAQDPSDVFRIYVRACVWVWV